MRFLDEPNKGMYKYGDNWTSIGNEYDDPGITLGNARGDRQRWNGLSTCYPEKVKRPNPRSPDNFGGKIHFAIAQLVTTLNLVEPYAVHSHSKFRGHGYHFFLIHLVGPGNYGVWPYVNHAVKGIQSG